MPKIPLTDEEAEALAVYIANLSDPSIATRYAATQGGLAAAVSTNQKHAE